VGIGTNNQGELLSLYYLLKFSNSKGIQILKVMRDFIMVINWMNNFAQVWNIRLQSLARKLKDATSQFQSIGFSHV